MHWDSGILAVRRWGAASAVLAGFQVAPGPIEALTMRREVMGA